MPKTVITPELVRHNPPLANKAHKTVPLNWTAILARAARSNAWYRIEHKFGTAGAASSAAGTLRKQNKQFEACSRDVYVFVRNKKKVG